MHFMHMFKGGVSAEAIENVTAPLSDSGIVEEEDSEPEDKVEPPAVRYSEIISFSTQICISKAVFVSTVNEE